MSTFVLGLDDGGHKYILCTRCNLKSYHREDIRQRYCVRCNAFHDDPTSYDDVVAEIMSSPSRVAQGVSGEGAPDAYACRDGCSWSPDPNLCSRCYAENTNHTP